MKAELVPENGDPPIPIVRDVTVIGRHESCDVVIQAVGLSKRHCVVVKTDGLLVIRDLATTNGTKVKGQRVRWAALVARRPDQPGGLQVPHLSGLGRNALAIGTTPRSSAGERTAGCLRAPVRRSSGNAPTARLPKEDAGLPAWNGRESAAAAAEENPSSWTAASRSSTTTRTKSSISNRNDRTASHG